MENFHLLGFCVFFVWLAGLLSWSWPPRIEDGSYSYQSYTTFSSLSCVFPVVEVFLGKHKDYHRSSYTFLSNQHLPWAVQHPGDTIRVGSGKREHGDREWCGGHSDRAVYAVLNSIHLRGFGFLQHCEHFYIISWGGLKWKHQRQVQE